MATRTRRPPARPKPTPEPPLTTRAEMLRALDALDRTLAGLCAHEAVTRRGVCKNWRCRAGKAAFDPAARARIEDLAARRTELARQILRTRLS